ncbi:protein FAM135A-like [Xenopus laevis]|uniref:Protein FAM135A-like n=1 Tax=Xenopus laevis TaxID=8355 RepID=A0A8J1M457_XENLA|nr:protein FAM135A-like [Xenopus laevis]XP_041436491.1 protein FAM135A-like [Xenopus laevis]
MKFDIYYAELNERKNLTPICSEDMTLHFNLHRGIHGHMNIVFKTLSKLSVNVHGLLVVLQPPLKNFPEKSSVFKRLLPNRWTKAKIPTLESVIFGKDFKKKLAADVSKKHEFVFEPSRG